MGVNKPQYTYLDKINSPAELKQLKVSELTDYCAELRDFIVRSCAENPGHLSSSIGAVELAVAIHYVFDFPTDKVVWDVGHQAYAHKIITGRRDEFANQRKLGGIGGFPRIAEGDSFGAGHSSVSISAAYGMAEAAELRGEKCKPRKPTCSLSSTTTAKLSTPTWALCVSTCCASPRRIATIV